MRLYSIRVSIMDHVTIRKMNVHDSSKLNKDGGLANTCKHSRIFVVLCSVYYGWKGIP